MKRCVKMLLKQTFFLGKISHVYMHKCFFHVYYTGEGKVENRLSSVQLTWVRAKIDKLLMGHPH